MGERDFIYITTSDLIFYSLETYGRNNLNSFMNVFMASDIDRPLLWGDL